jgi:hypothetical protein
MAPNHQPSAANPTRSNEDLNLAVLRRHWPTILSILHIAAYCVVYQFNPVTLSWEKADIDGTLFIVNHVTDPDGAERFSANILNRRRLENFAYELRDPEDVQLDPKFIILNEGEGDDQRVHGLWVFSEPPPNSTAHAHEVTGHIIKEFAKRAADVRQQLAEAQHNGHEGPAPAVQEVGESEEEDEGEEEEEAGPAEGAPMGRQVSLHEIFGVQRETDSSWSVHNHGGGQQQAAQPQQPLLSLFASNPDTDFFQTPTPPRKSPMSKGVGSAVPSAGSRPINLGDLFKAASNHKG